MGHSVNWEVETYYMEHGETRIVGLDEVGRGCWAGPLVAVCYTFNLTYIDIALADSKQLNATQRQSLAGQLKMSGSYGIGEVSAQEIDTLGLQQAQYEAYHRALRALDIIPGIILLDGRPWRGCPFPHEAIIKGDGRVASIAAASIVAKVHRDTLMQGPLHQAHPQYGFDTHVGYGTKHHRQTLEKYGPCELHRKSFKPVSWVVTRK